MTYSKNAPFRADVVGSYLRPDELKQARADYVNHELTCMVRHLQPTPNGIPVEVYCFSVIKEWVAYESVQADLFDHIIAVVPEFDLVLFQNPSGNDIQRIFRPARNVAAGA